MSEQNIAAVRRLTQEGFVRGNVERWGVVDAAGVMEQLIVTTGSSEASTSTSRR